MQSILFDVESGQKASGILSRAPGTSAVVVVHEWWGLNENIQEVCARISAAGFTALAPDLYHGTIAKTADQANHLMSQLDFSKSVAEIRSAGRHLQKHESITDLTVLGFCMGGALTLLTALSAPEFSRAVCFYGIPPKAAGDLAKIRIPVLAHFANQDDWCTPGTVDELARDFERGHVKAQIHRYEAAHAFANERRPEVYDASSAALAWQRTWDFITAK
ncbi:MAG: hypothetical protein RJB38_2459 [Pseudomonadota bacterium]|jgi:carboxymethylenebutenolidase